jgi:hypothetical protein
MALRKSHIYSPLALRVLEQLWLILVNCFVGVEM